MTGWSTKHVRDDRLEVIDRPPKQMGNGRVGSGGDRLDPMLYPIVMFRKT